MVRCGLALSMVWKFRKGNLVLKKLHRFTCECGTLRTIVPVSYAFIMCFAVWCDAWISKENATKRSVKLRSKLVFGRPVVELRGNLNHCWEKGAPLQKVFQAYEAVFKLPAMEFRNRLYTACWVQRSKYLSGHEW